MDIIEHYDKLVNENNDPVYDPQPLKEYMDKWDGTDFIDALRLDKEKTVLEIGVGTGRLALKTIPFCKKFTGIDISPKTIDRASQNLSKYQNVELICDDFITHSFSCKFDIIYSSLTFMHIKEKLECINKISHLLNFNGRFIISIDKNQNKYIEYDNRKLEIYPDNPNDIQTYIKKSNLVSLDCIETEFAYIFVSSKA
ncbi:MAG: class I SAM-dependent methyltransferase [Clostridia bacterium]|nr:class I SAM-dependent methyltransferase [Clostridia bacterium]